MNKPLRGKYAGNLEIILYKFLLSQEHGSDEGVCVQAVKNWCKTLGLCSEKYYDDEYTDGLLNEEIKCFTKQNLYTFYYQENNRMKILLYSVLDRLSAKEVLDYKESYALCMENGTERIVTEEEKESIKKAEDDAMKIMRFYSMYDIHRCASFDLYYKKVYDLLASGDYLGDFQGIKKYFKVMEIRYSHKHIRQRLEEIFYAPDEDSEIFDIILTNNARFTESLRKTIENKVEKKPAYIHEVYFMKYLIDELILIKNDEILDTCKEFFDRRKQLIG